MLKGLLFDFDGVVVDSMEQHFQAWHTAFSNHGIDISRKGFFLLEGQGMETIANILATRHGLTSQETISVIKDKAAYFYTHHELKFYNYFLTMLGNIKTQGIPMAIVTGGNKERVKPIIDTHLSGFFDAVITVDDVSRGKPYPEPFLAGAKSLGIPADACIVIENAPLGIKAAKAAKCKVIAVKTTLGVMDLGEADFIAVDFKEVEAVINDWLGKKAGML